MSDTEPAKPKVLVIVHNDLWGVLISNKLMKAVVEQGCEPVLIVSQREKGIPEDTLPALKGPRYLKEIFFRDFMNWAEAQHEGKLPKSPDALLSFDMLARKYCGAKKAEYVRVWKDGGKDVEDMITAMPKDAKPKLILSGDTMAKLTKETTDNYPCYGTHPAPLPGLKGLLGVITQAIRFPLYPVIGTLFRLSEKLDKGQIVETATIGHKPKESLIELRARLYDSLITCMLKHLPAMLADKVSLREQKNDTEKVEPLTNENVETWLRNPEHKLIDKQYMLSVMARMLPNGAYIHHMPHEMRNYFKDFFKPKTGVSEPAAEMREKGITEIWLNGAF